MPDRGYMKKSEKPSLIISTLEALAVLFSLLLFFDSPSENERKRVQVAPTWTDNRANGSALNKVSGKRGFNGDGSPAEEEESPGVSSMDTKDSEQGGRLSGKWKYAELQS